VPLLFYAGFKILFPKRVLVIIFPDIPVKILPFMGGTFSLYVD
jgi:hypothetical protein